MPISFVSLGTYFTAYDGLQDTNFPTPVVENVVGNWKPVSYGHPLKDATMFYAPPSLERVVISGGSDVITGNNNIDRLDRGNTFCKKFYYVIILTHEKLSPLHSSLIDFILY